MRFDELLQEAADTGSLNYIRDGVSIMSIPSYKKFICRQLATLLEVLLRCCPHIKLNPEALAILFLDTATNCPLDAISTWEYAPGMDAAKRLEMKTFTQKIAEEQLRIAMTIPSQLKRMDGKTIGKDKDTGEFKALPQSQVKAMAAAMVALKLKKKKAKGRDALSTLLNSINTDVHVKFNHHLMMRMMQMMKLMTLKMSLYVAVKDRKKLFNNLMMLMRMRMPMLHVSHLF